MDASGSGDRWFPHGEETMGSWSPSLQMEEKSGPISKKAENQWVNRVLVDLSLSQAAKPWFHQYLDLAWYDLWRLVSENVNGEYMGYSLLIHGVYWG